MGSPYGQYPQQPGYGQNPPYPGYVQQPGYPPQPAPVPPVEIHHHHYGRPSRPYAEWGARVAASLLDGLVIGGPALFLSLLGVVLMAVGFAGGPGEENAGLVGLGFILLLVACLAVAVAGLWSVHLEGTTGQTFGKRRMNIMLVAEHSGQPIGFGAAFVRRMAHGLDGFAFCLGFLWPLFDPKKQTFADKVMGTVVVQL
ncbi:RDD family protein [Thermomonospora curvata]|uniref:RDD domain containing protein n=1 Tax=Thermomonospora curvata (strain ATCC 19995 / DSM 43183 / JCM 3096 / KCTC 9072 / NBRC 15933 / NCIMB 10081 / Henssen B9) TaxID=471852 RepID=D1A7C9_THECD|nr:RDD family protein [Thermomonospora curvata]ACZ00335.1 RDD domain containing protein [Thermomonospora curvata DSM 43183]